MPSSHLYQINEILALIMATNPESLLDVGVGFGKYGFLSREYLELWDGREQYHDWKRRIVGIEACKKYLTPLCHQPLGKFAKRLRAWLNTQVHRIAKAQSPTAF